MKPRVAPAFSVVLAQRRSQALLGSNQPRARAQWKSPVHAKGRESRGGKSPRARFIECAFVKLCAEDARKHPMGALRA